MQNKNKTISTVWIDKTNQHTSLERAKTSFYCLSREKERATINQAIRARANFGCIQGRGISLSGHPDNR